MDNEYGWIDQALIDAYEVSCCMVEEFEWEVREETLEENDYEQND